MKKSLLTLGLAVAVSAAAIAPAGVKISAKADAGKVADIWVVAGQSNAAGWSNLSYYGIGGTQVGHNYLSDLAAKDERNSSGYSNVLYYGSGLDWRADRPITDIDMKLSPVKMGGAAQAGTTGHVGPELGMANVLSETHTEDNPAVIVKYAVGGTYLCDFGGAGQQTVDYGNWASPTMTQNATAAGTSLHANNGLLYTRLLQTLDGACAALKQKGYTPSIKGYIWMQGEADAGTVALANAYEQNLTDFINDLRRDVAVHAEDAEAVNRPFVIGKINSSGAFGGSIATVRAAEDKVATALDNVYTVDTDTYKIINGGEIVGSDRWHFNANDMYDLGKRFATTALANMAQYTYYVTAEAGGKTAENTVRSLDGEAVQIHVSEDRGKLVDKVLLNDTDITASAYSNGVVTITPSAGDGSTNNVKITFRDREKQTLTIKIGKGGKIGSRSPSGTTVYEGETLSITPKPDAGYEVDAVTLNGVPMTEADGRYTAVLEAKDYVLEVTFKQATVTPPPSVQQPKEEKDFPAWGIALIVVGGVLVLAGAVAGAYFGLKKTKKGQKSETEETQDTQDKQD